MTHAFLPERIRERGSQAGPVVKPPAESSELAAGAAPTAAIGVWPGGWSSNPLALDDILAYQRDFWERAILFWDTLRQRADNMIAHERAGKPRCSISTTRPSLVPGGSRDRSTMRYCASRVTPTGAWRIVSIPQSRRS